MNNKPELLLPAGNVEAFHGAMEGGADAVYLGLREFNARERASNFTPEQLQSILKYTGDQGKKVYLTLNTVIKNEELPRLIELLSILSQTSIAAVIIQDWGVYHLLRNYFPKLKIHASTQMQNHNSVGASFSERMGFERIILARELMLEEIKSLRENSNIELEAFTHGALCYSMSGACLFSSYLGGSGANRGLCAQPCRRYYYVNEDKKFLFSLKDHQLIDYVPQLTKTGIKSFKIEGRMKSGEYTHKVAQAYRMAIDNPDQIEEAKKLLQRDMGRDKTSFFIGQNISQAITENPASGILIGKVTRQDEEGFSFPSKVALKEGNRIRIHSADGEVKEALKLKDFEANRRNFIKVKNPDHQVEKGDLIFLSDLREDKFKNKLEVKGDPVPKPLIEKEKQKILKEQQHKKKHNQQQIFVRIDSIEWMKKIYIRSVDKVILQLPKRSWKDLKTGNPFLIKNRKKFIIEFPKFIAEKDIDFFKDIVKHFMREGFNHFMISQLSQMDLIPKEAMVSVNENVYSFNDASISLYNRLGLRYWTYPLENDMENLTSGTDRDGIVPMFFHPELFYSRVPVKVHDENDNHFRDDMGNAYHKSVKDGMTTIWPDIPVSFFQYAQQLKKEGFHNFMIDLSKMKPSQNRFNTLLKRLLQGEQLQPSSNFNFGRELK